MASVSRISSWWVVAACTAIALPARAQDLAPDSRKVQMVERSSDDEVLVDLRIDRTIITEAIPGYANKSGLMLPLGQIAQALEFSIKVIPQDGQADGWILSEDNKFTLDVIRHEVLVNGSRSSFRSGMVEPHTDDIYVDTSLLSEWFKIDFEFSFANQSVTLKTRDGMKLPIQIKTEREQARKNIGRGDSRGPEGPFPRTEVPYQLYTIPFTDFTYTGGYDKRSYSGLHNSANLLSSGDLLYMHSSIYATGDETDTISDFRITLSRRDPDGNIFQSDDWLGKTKLGEAMKDYEIRDVSLGDINTDQLPLTAFNQQARGILISNIPYDRATQYDRTTLQGDLPSGWEVELYRNDELLSFQRASANGRYEFVDVPLLSGLNIMRLVFYGPFGQTREETQRFLVSDNLIQQGKSYFRTSLSQQNTNTVDVLQQRQITTLSGATPEQIAAVKGKPRALFEYEYGLLNNVSLFASAAHLTTPDTITRDYLSTGLGTTIAGAYGRVDYAHDMAEGGNAIKFLVQDSFGSVTVSAEHQQYFDFISEFTEAGNDSVTRRSTARADAPLTLPFLRLNNGVSFTQTLYDSDRKVDEYTYRLSTSVNRLSLSNNITYRTDSSPVPSLFTGIGGVPIVVINRNKQTTGEFIASYPLRNWVLRGNVLYGLSPEKEIQTLLASTEYDFARNSNAIFQIDKQLIGQKLTNYTLGLNHNFEKFRLGGNVGHASDGENTVGITLSLSFGEDPRNGKFRFYPEYSASNGLISARSFHDVNGNGVFDEGDQPIEGAKFLVNRGGTPQPTDENGTVLLRNLQPDTRSSLTLDNKTIENPYLQNKQPGLDVVTRPGVAALVDFPLVGSGDIEGAVHILSVDADTKDATNVTVQLYTLEGKILREVQTSFDGYYLFNSVPAGDYIIRVSLEQAARLGFITPPDRAVTITSNETDSRIIDLDIIREPSVASEATTETPPQT